MSFTDTGADPPPAVDVIGDATTHYFWVVRSRNGDGVSGVSNGGGVPGASNRVGEFEFLPSCRGAERDGR